MNKFNMVSSYVLWATLLLTTVPSWSGDLSKCAKFYKPSINSELAVFVQSALQQRTINDSELAMFARNALKDAIATYGENTSVFPARIDSLVRNQLEVLEFKMEYLMKVNPEVGEFVFENLTRFSQSEKETLFHGVFFIINDPKFGLGVVTPSSLDFRHAAESIFQMWAIQGKLK